MDELVVVENFLSPEQCREGMEVLDSLFPIVNPSDRERHSEWNSFSKFEQRFFNGIYKKFVEVSGRDDLFPHICGMFRYSPGYEGLTPHIDMEMDPNMGVGDCYECKFSAAIYLNDGYEGGNLFFPNIDKEFSPKAGLMIYFPGYKSDYMHGAHGLVSGYKYAMSVCFTSEPVKAHPAYHFERYTNPTR